MNKPLEEFDKHLRSHSSVDRHKPQLPLSADRRNQTQAKPCTGTAHYRCFPTDRPGRPRMMVRATPASSPKKIIAFLLRSRSRPTISGLLPDAAGTPCALSLPLSVTSTLVPNFSGVAIPRQIGPGATLRPRVVPSVIVVIIVKTAVDIVRVFQFHNKRKGRCDGNAGAVRSRSHNTRSQRNAVNQSINHNFFIISSMHLYSAHANIINDLPITEGISGIRFFLFFIGISLLSSIFYLFFRGLRFLRFFDLFLDRCLLPWFLYHVLFASFVSFGFAGAASQVARGLVKLNGFPGLTRSGPAGWAGFSCLLGFAVATRSVRPAGCSV